MANELAKAYIQIIPSADGIRGSITKVLGGESNSAGQQAGNTIASTIKSVILTAGIGKALSNALMEGANLQQSTGGIETLFKESSDTMKKYANEAYKTAGLSANSYMEQATSFSASLLQSLSGDTKKAAEAANQAIVDMADNSNKMGTSLELIQNAYQGFAKQNYTMLDNLKLGYGGTKTEMERLLADAQQLSGVEYDISNLSDIYSAIHIIQEELGIAGATSLEAKETFSGSFAAMKASVQNFMGYLTTGQDVKPALEALLSTSSTFFFDNFLPMAGNIVAALPTVIGAVITQAVPLLLEKGKEILVTLTTGVTNEFPTMSDTGTETVVNFINGLLDNLPSLLSTGRDLIIDFANSLNSMTPHIVESAYEIVSAFIMGIIRNLPQILEVGLTLIGRMAVGIINGIPGLITKSLSIFSEVKKAFNNLDWLGIGRNIIDGIANGISGAVWNVVRAAKNAASSALNSIKSFLGIHSPSKVFDTEVGKMITMGLANGIENNLQPVTDAMQSLNDETIGLMNSDFNAASNLGTNRGTTVDGTLAKILEALLSIDAKSDKNFVLTFNARQLAYSLGADMNVVLNRLNQEEQRR